MANTDQRSNPSGSTPWWRVKMVWLVIGGPVLVVIASFITLSLALKYPDPVLRTSTSPGTASASRPAEEEGSTKVVPADLPALQGRNNAITGGR